MAFPSGWTRKCPITISGSRVYTTTNYPALIMQSNLPVELFTLAKADGSDIRFTSDSAGTTLLPREIAYYDNISSRAEIWVKIPSLTTGSNITIYIWYGNAAGNEPAFTDSDGRNSVWSDYRAVWHFNGTTGTANKLLDSTGNGWNFTEVGAVASTTGNYGQTNGAYRFNGIDAYLSGINSLGGAFYGNTPTIEGWAKPISFVGGNDIDCLLADQDLSPSNLAYLGIKYIASNHYFESYRGPDNWATNTLDDLFVGNWYYGAFIYNGTTGNDIYYNGTKRWNVPPASAPTTGASAGMTVGARLFSGWPYDFANIDVDELRVSTTNKTDNYFLTNWNNQNSPTTFSSAGTAISATTFKTQIIII